MGVMDIFNAKKIKEENDQLKRILEDIGGNDIVIVNNKIKELEAARDEIQQKIENSKKEIELEKLGTQKTIEKMKAEIAELDNEIRTKKNQIIVLDDELSFESFALYKPHFEFSTSEEYKNKLDAIRETQKGMIKNNTAATGNQNWTVNNSVSQGKRMVNDMIKLVIRSFNNECDYCVDNVKFNTMESNEKRIMQSYETLNKLGTIMQVSISWNYLQRKLDELHLAFEYQQKKQQEKEEQKRIREELREQAKLEQEIKQARERIDKERKHIKKALDEINTKIANTTNEKELKALNDELIKLQKSITDLNKEESLIDYREKNAKAGYVYIISNIGAFGENIYKIGMTRRLEPLERIDELSDASVPFSFDVHALIFSENAPDLEAKLHQHFYKGRLNKINDRKEFFKAEIKEIEKVIRENYNNVFDITVTAPAEEWRESILLE